MLPNRERDEPMEPGDRFGDELERGYVGLETRHVELGKRQLARER